MMEPPPPRPIIDMGRGMEPHMENGKLPYAAHQENYHQQQVHKVYLSLHYLLVFLHKKWHILDKFVGNLL